MKELVKRPQSRGGAWVAPKSLFASGASPLHQPAFQAIVGQLKSAGSRSLTSTPALICDLGALHQNTVRMTTLATFALCPSKRARPQSAVGGHPKVSTT